MNRTTNKSASTNFLPRNSTNPVDWIVESEPVEYEYAVNKMESLVEEIIQGKRSECAWLLEHPSIYTAGTSAKPTDLIEPSQFEVFNSGRGGQYTYHGPGQRVIYLMLDLNRRNPDLRAYVSNLESWIINTLENFNIRGEKREKRIGIWVPTYENQMYKESKIAAIGIRVRKWISFHGISINVNPNLEHYSGIVPCGISEHGVTSFKELKGKANMVEIDKILRIEFEKQFGPTVLKGQI